MRIIGNDPSTPRQAQIVASGTLSTGDAVVVNADGTVSVVAETAITAAFGSITTASSSEIQASAAVYDEASNKVVVFYKDNGNNQYGTAIVGTISDTSISFGSPVVYSSQRAAVGTESAAYDGNQQKVVVSYLDYDNGQYRAIVGAVSGTSISFGSPASIYSGTSSSPSVVYDVNAQKIVVGYHQRNNSYRGVMHVGTVSGTSISFGSAQVFNSNESNGITLSYDPAAQKVVACYRDNGNSQYGTAIAGTLSGTSVSFGSPFVFRSATTNDNATCYDANANKTIVCFQDSGNSNRGTAYELGLSGSTVSLGNTEVFDTNTCATFAPVYNSSSSSLIILYRNLSSSAAGTYVLGSVGGLSSPAVFDSTNIENSSLSAVYDITSNRVVSSYVDTVSSPANQLKSIVYRSSGTSTNLTSENYIGTAAAGAADTQRAKINLKGAVDENQSGLTAGQSYYVQTDGTLGTTPADPSVFAGTAVAATKLIVKG